MIEVITKQEYIIPFWVVKYIIIRYQVNTPNNLTKAGLSKLLFGGEAKC